MPIRIAWFPPELIKVTMKERVDNNQCRMSDSALETLNNFIAGSTVLTPVQYMHSHNGVCKVIHDNSCIQA